MALVTVIELEGQSGEAFTDDDWVLGETLIPQVEAEIEAYLGRSIEPRAHTENHQLNWQNNVLYLQNTPVSSVSSVTVNGFPVNPTFYAVSFWGVLLYSYGMSFNAPINSPLWTSPTLDYIVSYVGGLDGANIPALKGVVVRTALREMSMAREGWDGRAGYMSVKTEDFSYRKDNFALTGVMRGMRDYPAGLLHPRDQTLLDNWKRKTVVSY